MSNNPYSNNPINSQPTDLYPQMPDLPLKQVPQTPVVPEGQTNTDSPQEGELLQVEPPGQTLAWVMGKVNDFLQWFAITLEIALLLRFIFMLIGADPLNVFASFIYALTSVILFPFSNIVHNPSLHVNQAFEFTTLIGMGIYALIFWLLRWLVRITITDPAPTE